VVIAAITGYLLSPQWLNIHLISGTLIAALLVFRVLWGFTGTWFSRFRSFAYSPTATLSHVKELVRGMGEREAGHNPVGALMVFALLACLALIVVSGVALLGGQFKQGPFKSLLSFAAAMNFRDIHSVFAGILLGLIAGHLAGVIFESFRTAENLAAAMVTGKKRGGFLSETPAVRAHWGISFVVSCVLCLIFVPATIKLSELPPSGVAPLTINGVWAKECSSCHIAFHPSLLPAKSWSSLMANLADHFGEDASLDPASTKEIADFLMSHSAETWDTLAANRLRTVNPSRPLEITATLFWARRHQDIPPAVFKSKLVGAKQNCIACHADAASGMFAPQLISIPQEKKP
jgi:cytochrome b